MVLSALDSLEPSIGPAGCLQQCTLKILLLQTQLDIDPEILKLLELLGYFVAVIYTPSWFRALVVTEAAVIDLELYKSYSLSTKMKCSEMYALLQSLHYEDISST